MAEETQAAPSPAAVAEAPIEIPRSGTSEYAEWRVSGELPEKPKPSEAAAPPDDAADSAATTTQEKPSKRRPDVEARFKEYTARIDKLERELNEARQPKTEKPAESSPAKTQPETYSDWRKEFKPSQWVEKYGKDNPEASYEDATAAMADYLGDVRDQFRSIETQRETQKKSFMTQVEESRKRYGDSFDQTVAPTAQTIQADKAISPVVKQMLTESEHLPDLLFTLGGDSEAFKSFLETAKTSPGKAIRYIAKLEAGIADELAGKGSEASSERNDKGQFTAKETPVKRGPESAPDPPIELGSRGTGTLSESDRALKAAEAGDPKAMRAWMEAENRKDLARRKGN